MKKEKAVTGTRCGNIEEDRKLAVSLGEQIAARLQNGKVYLIGCRTGRYRPNNNERHGSPERSRCDCL